MSLLGDIFKGRDREGTRLRRWCPGTYHGFPPADLGQPTGPPCKVSGATITHCEKGYLFANPTDVPVSIVFEGRDVYLPPRTEVGLQFEA